MKTATTTTATGTFQVEATYTEGAVTIWNSTNYSDASGKYLTSDATATAVSTVQANGETWYKLANGGYVPARFAAKLALRKLRLSHNQPKLLPLRLRLRPRLPHLQRRRHQLLIPRIQRLVPLLKIQLQQLLLQLLPPRPLVLRLQLAPPQLRKPLRHLPRRLKPLRHQLLVQPLPLRPNL